MFYVSTCNQNVNLSKLPSLPFILNFLFKYKIILTFWLFPLIMASILLSQYYVL